jgi:hypothetical protein
VAIFIQAELFHAFADVGSRIVYQDMKRVRQVFGQPAPVIFTGQVGCYDLDSNVR